MVAKKTLPKTIIVDGNNTSFPKSPASPKNRTAIWISNKPLLLAFTFL